MTVEEKARQPLTTSTVKTLDVGAPDVLVSANVTNTGSLRGTEVAQWR